MKSLVFDTSTIISIATNNLLWVLPELKKRFKGEFYIAPSVKQEVIDKPINTNRYKLEAMQILSLVGSGQIKVFRNNTAKKTGELAELANHIFRTKDTWVRIVHAGEIESLAIAIEIHADAYVIDERNTRVLVESPELLGQLLEQKLHTKVLLNRENLEKFKAMVKGVSVIRSVDLMTVAYELGVMDVYLKKEVREIVNIDLRRNLLEGLLWGLRLKGCSVSSDEISEIVKMKG